MPASPTTRAVLDHARHAGRGQRPQAGLAGQRRNHSGVGPVARLRAIHARFEVHRHLEQFPEVRVELIQQVVEEPVADQHDFDVQRNRLGIERHRADQAERLPDGFDPNRVRAQRTLEAFPRKRLEQHAPGVDEQVTAVGLVQRGRLDVREVGDEHPHVGHVFDAANQILKRRLVFIDDRRAGDPPVIVEHVHLIPAQRRLGGAGPGDQRVERARLLLTLFRPPEIVRVLDHVFLERGEIALHPGLALVRLLQLVDQRIDRRFRGGVFERPDLLVAVTLPLRHFVQDLLEIAFEPFERGPDALPVALRQLLERV